MIQNPNVEKMLFEKGGRNERVCVGGPKVKGRYGQNSSDRLSSLLHPNEGRVFSRVLRLCCTV